MKAWFIHWQGKPVGPYTEEQLISGLQNDKIPGSTPVWSEGMAEWAQASSLHLSESNAAIAEAQAELRLAKEPEAAISKPIQPTPSTHVATAYSSQEAGASASQKVAPSAQIIAASTANLSHSRSPQALPKQAQRPVAMRSQIAVAPVTRKKGASFAIDGGIKKFFGWGFTFLLLWKGYRFGCTAPTSNFAALASSLKKCEMSQIFENNLTSGQDKKAREAQLPGKLKGTITLPVPFSEQSDLDIEAVIVKSGFEVFGLSRTGQGDLKGCKKINYEIGGLPPDSYYVRVLYAPTYQDGDQSYRLEGVNGVSGVKKNSPRSVKVEKSVVLGVDVIVTKS